MAHGTRVNGASYGITGGKCRVNGTVYDIKKGRTLIGGTGYDITFKTEAIINVDVTAFPGAPSVARIQFTKADGGSEYISTQYDNGNQGDFIVKIGSRILCYASGDGIYLNGIKVADAGEQYDYTVIGDADIELHAAGVSASIDITEKGV